MRPIIPPLIREVIHRYKVPEHVATITTLLRPPAMLVLTTSALVGEAQPIVRRLAPVLVAEVIAHRAAVLVVLTGVAEARVIHQALAEAVVAVMEAVVVLEATHQVLAEVAVVVILVLLVAEVAHALEARDSNNLALF
jgi:hypothetical protein